MVSICQINNILHSKSFYYILFNNIKHVKLIRQDTLANNIKCRLKIQLNIDIILVFTAILEKRPLDTIMLIKQSMLIHQMHKLGPSSTQNQKKVFKSPFPDPPHVCQSWTCCCDHRIQVYFCSTRPYYQSIFLSTAQKYITYRITKDFNRMKTSSLFLQ